MIYIVIEAIETEDVDVPVAASGWGQLYEQDKRVKHLVQWQHVK